jgi:hypothetical protein
LSYSSNASATPGRDDIPVFDSAALDALGGLFDTLARGLDLADRLERVEGGGETSAYLRTLVLSFITAVRSSGVVSSGPSDGGPAVPSDPGVPPVTPPSDPTLRAFPPAPTGPFAPPEEGEVAYAYVARHVFGPNDALSRPEASGHVCWYEDIYNPDNREQQHVAWWAPPDAPPPPGASPTINTDTGRQWTAWEFVKAAMESAFPIGTDIDEDYVYRGGVWLPPELFI